jgi:HlyD family secretion protein
MMADQTTPIESQSDIDAFLGGKTEPKWKRYAKWGAIGVFVLLLAFALWSWLSPAAQAGYETQQVRQGDLTVSVSATGKLAPTNQVQVGSQLSGLVTQVVVDVNDRVTAGQALALIDPEQLDDQIRQGQAALDANLAQIGQAEATLAEARAQLNRLEEVRRLSGGRVPSDTELATARANTNRAVAALKVAQANAVASRAALAQSQTQRARAIIRSPVSGVVLARQVDPGQTVAASFNTPTLFVIAEDLSAMKLEVAIDEADVGSVKDGQDATFAVDAFPGRTFPARITRVDVGSNLSAQAASSSSTATSTSSTTGQVISYAAELSVDNPELQLRPGMTATAEIVTSRKERALLVPNAALRFTPTAAAGGAQAKSGVTGALIPRGGRRGNRPERTAKLDRGATQTVYILNAAGEPQAVSVTTGDTNGQMTEVTGGDLKPGARVITGQLSGEESAGKAGGGGRSKGGGGRQGGGG